MSTFSLSVATVALLKEIKTATKDQVAVVAGYLVSGDGGGGTFVWDDVSTENEDPQKAMIVSPGTTKGRWKRLHDGVLNVKWFGAKGDGSTDDIVAIQAAVDWAIYQAPLSGPVAAKPSRIRTVYLPPGTYRTTNTIHLGYGVGFTSITFRGSGPKYDTADPRQSGTNIFCDFTDRPGINVQGARQTRIEGLTVEGKYSYILANNLGYDPTKDDLEFSTWIDQSFPVKAYTGFAPYAGISIDAFAGDPGVANHYPAVNYPSYVGTNVGQYNKSHSSDVQIVDCDVIKFCVGIGRFSESNSNGEFIHIRGGQTAGCIYGIAICHNQARNTRVSDHNLNQCYYSISGNLLGREQGNLHGTYHNVHFGGVINMINGSAGYSGPVTLRDCYAESVARLGSFGALGDGQALTLDNCYFNFRETGVEQWGVPDNHFGGADLKLVIRNSLLIVNQFFLVASNHTSVVLDGAMIWAFNAGSDLATAEAKKNAVWGTAGLVALLDTRVTATSVYYRADGQYYDAGLDHSNGPLVPYVCHRKEYHLLFSGSQRGHAFLDSVPRVCSFNTQGFAVTPSNVSGATAQISRTTYTANGTPLDLGDVLSFVSVDENNHIIPESQIVCVVTGVVPDPADPTKKVAVITQMSNFRMVDGAFTSTSNGDLTKKQLVQAFYLCRMYTAQLTLAGTATSGSNTLTNIKTLTDGDQVVFDPLQNNIKVGDLWIAPDPEFINVGVGPTPSSTRMRKITATDQAGQTMTLDSSIPFNKSPIFVNYFLKVYNP